jgi:hypothetical protein
MIHFRDARKWLEILSIGTLVIIALAYGGFRAYPLFTGPRIIIYSPLEGDYVASTTFQISGQVLRAREITLQGKPITIDTDGHFTETLVAQAPYTILVLVATDKYNAMVSKVIRVVPH